MTYYSVFRIFNLLKSDFLPHTMTTVISKVADKIYLIGHYPKGSMYSFQSFFIVDEKPVLIELGPTNFALRILDSLHKLGYEASSLAYIIPTHIHADHCGGTGYLARQSPNAKVVVHKSGAKHLIDPTRLIEASKASWDEDYQREIGPVIPVPEEQIKVIHGGETISLGKRTLSIIHSPGHARHHICPYDANSGELFCGEALGMLLPGEEVMVLPIAAPPVFELDVALNTINKLKRLKPSTIFYSHFGISHHASRCIELVEQNTREWGNIVLRALQAGESSEQIRARLKAILDKLNPGMAETFPLYLDWSVTAYTGYFAKKGMVTHN